MKKLQNRKGFTLVELLIVMAIIGILVLIAVPRFARSTDAARVRTLQANARTLASAVSMFVADHSGTRPTGVAQLVTDRYVDQATFGADGTANTRPTGSTYAYVPGTGVITASVPVDTMEQAQAPEGVTIANNRAEITINVTN